MDTKEKKRERTAPRNPGEERRRRPSSEEAERRKERPRRQAEAQPESQQQRKATRQRPEEKPTRQNPEQRRQRPEGGTPRRSREEVRQRPASRQPVSSDVRLQRPVEQVYRPSASQQRVRQEGDIPFAAPQGMGMRKSAPKMSPQETAALRKKQQNAVSRQAPQKKNALQHLISGTQGQAASSLDPAAKAELRRKQRADREKKKRKTAQRYDTPAVIYTQPQAFNRDRLLLQLLTVTAIVAALVLGMSVFFKVKTITVAGAETYSTQAVQDASGIQEGDNLLTFSKASASAKIRAKLSYVDNIRIGIKLPDTVIIYIEELDVAYAMESSLGDWWLINSDGRVVDQIDSKRAGEYTQVLGVVLDNPQIGSQAMAADFVMQNLTPEGETQGAAVPMETAAPVPIVVTGAQRLSSALQILKALEANDIVGEAASVEVSDLEDITLWYGSRYEVLLGDTTRMDYKIACMNDAILQMSEYQSGILDISFTTWEDQVGYTPFG